MFNSVKSLNFLAGRKPAEKQYSLFWRDGKAYHRLSTLAFNKPVATAFFSDYLLQGAQAGVQLTLRAVDPSEPLPLAHIQASEERFKALTGARKFIRA